MKKVSLTSRAAILMGLFVIPFVLYYTARSGHEGWITPLLLLLAIIMAYLMWL